MTLEEFNKILVIISTNKILYRRLKNKIENKLKSIVSKEKILIKLTRDANSNREYTKEFIKNNSNSLIISVGGDGSISEVTEEIYNSGRDDIFFSFIPNGTGNDFAKTIYPNLKTNDIIKKLRNFVIRDIDLIKINNNTAINVAGFGFESIVLENSLIFKKKFPYLSKISFLIGIFMSLRKLKPIEYDYIFTFNDGSIKKGKNSCIMNAICNAKYYGGGFIPAPEAKIDDNVIDFNYIDYVGVFRLLSLIKKYKTKKHMDLNISHTLKLNSGKIYSKRNKITGNIDGNIYKFNELDFLILNKAIKLLVFE